MSTASSRQAVQQLYLAYYWRPADPDGLEFWATKLDTQGGNLNGILDAFANSVEATANFVGKSNQELIQTVYQVLFDRTITTSDPGLSFYSNLLLTGQRTLQSIALDILNGATGNDRTLIDNKIAVADQFTNALDTALERANYTGQTAIVEARKIISQVTTNLDNSMKLLPIAGDLVNLLKGLPLEPAPAPAPAVVDTKPPLLMFETITFDLPGNSNTSALIKADGTMVGGYFDSSSTRQDWYSTRVEAGQVYQFKIDSTAGTNKQLMVVQDNFVQNTVVFDGNSDSIYLNVTQSGTAYFAVKGSSTLQGQLYLVSVQTMQSVNVSGYQVEYKLDPSLLAYKPYFDAAAQKIASVVQSDLPAMASALKDGLVDDLLVQVTVDPTISGSLLGYAGPVALRSDTFLPYEAEMSTTAAVLSRLAASTAVDFILHETLHAMGIGTLWQNKDLLNSSGDYIGINGLNALRTMANNPNLTSVPVDGSSGHFAENIFGNEVMTPLLGKSSAFSPLSVAALADLGYTVDFTQAEHYVLPVGVVV